MREAHGGEGTGRLQLRACLARLVRRLAVVEEVDAKLRRDRLPGEARCKGMQRGRGRALGYAAGIDLQVEIIRLARLSLPLPALALLGGATLWGVVWYPYRLLAQAGIDGLWATLFTYGFALLLAVLVFPKHARVLR